MRTIQILALATVATTALLAEISPVAKAIIALVALLAVIAAGGEHSTSRFERLLGAARKLIKGPPGSTK